MPTWDERKRLRNIKVHGFDFAGADAVWDGYTVTREDIRKDYGERRMVAFGVLDDHIVVVVHTERDGGMHVISLRKAEPHEARYYLEITAKHLGK